MAEKRRGKITSHARSSAPAASRNRADGQEHRSRADEDDTRAPSERAPAQPDTIDSRRIIAMGIALAVIVLVCAVSILLLEAHFAHALGRPRAAIDAPSLPEVAGPPPQTSPQRDLAAYRADKRRWLETYGWVDRQAGIVHLPIDEAMAHIAQQRGGGTKASP